MAAAAYGLDLSAEDLGVSAYMDNGRFQTSDSLLTGEIISRTGAKWLIEKEVDEAWSVSAQIHLFFWRNQAVDKELFHVAGVKFDSDLRGYLSWKRDAQFFKGGVYNFKYNPDSKDLGEYLLRSTAYPTILESMQGKDLMEPSFSRVLGAQYGLNYEYFRTLGLAYFEQFNTPVYDASLAYFATVGPSRAEVGLGIAYPRFLHFGDRKDVTPLDPSLEPYIDNKDLGKNEIKISLRGRVDLAAYLEMSEPFGVYAEAALLGLKNDTLLYKNMNERMPLMIGMDIPTFGILSALTLELEYFKNPYLERKYGKSDNNGRAYSVLPNIDDYASPPRKTSDDMRWSATIIRSLNRWFDLKVRLANNHMRLVSWNEDYVTGEPYTKRGSDWLCLIRLEYHN